jgi:hypothetical protein
MNTHDGSKFTAGHGTYKCDMCGKLTRDTGQGEGELELCLKCMVTCELENMISDGADQRWIDAWRKKLEAMK